MSMQTIKTIDGNEYVLLPVHIYKNLKKQIKACIESDANEYVPFVTEDYVDNPVLLARVNSNVTQQELAQQMQVSQAYISKLEKQDNVSAKVLSKVREAILRLK